jgi:hypothetical protein
MKAFATSVLRLMGAFFLFMLLINVTELAFPKMEGGEIFWTVFFEFGVVLLAIARWPRRAAGGKE